MRGANGRVSQHTIDVAIGVNLESQKELLGLWLAENEGAEFWRHVLTDLKNRGLKDIFVAGHRPQVGRDGLTGFSEAIKTVSERTKVQLCVVHLVRAAMRDVVDKDCRRGRSQEDRQRRGCECFVEHVFNVLEILGIWHVENVPHEIRSQARRDARRSRTSIGEFRSSLGREISDDLEDVANEVDRHHHAVRLRCGFISTVPIRRAISTTNAIESVNRVIRKLTRNRKISPNEDSALKITSLAIREASKKWTMPIPKWKAALNHFAILFENRLPQQQS